MTMPAAQMIEEYAAIFAACTSTAELASVVSGIDFVTMDGATVGAITVAAMENYARLNATSEAASNAAYLPNEQLGTSTPLPHNYREETINRALAKNLTINDKMVTNSHTLRAVAIDFVQTYTGVNSFVQNIAIHLADRGFLSIPQMRGALNVMLAEAKIERAQAIDQPVYIDLRSTAERTVDEAGTPPAADDQPADTRRIPNGTYTVILDADTDGYRTIRLADAPAHFNAAQGTQIASYLAGADNEAAYVGFAFVLGKSITIWKKYRVNGTNPADRKIKIALTDLIDSADPMAHMREYVLRSARCGVCGRKLTTPDSIRMGIGPICAGKLEAQGYTFTMPAQARAILAAKPAPAVNPAATKEEKIEAARKATADINELFG
jgi:uncharacterized protein DUF6011